MGPALLGHSLMGRALMGQALMGRAPGLYGPWAVMGSPGLLWAGP